MPGKAAAIAKPSLMLEERHEGPVCGIDEAGRGPLAGPVLAACVYVPEDTRRLPFLAAINDSKKLTMKKREALFAEINRHCACGAGMASPEEIDTLNIHHATLLAMKRAWQNMRDACAVRPVMALVDGKFTPELPCPREAVKGGDGVSLSIAAASIIAKVTRDRIMAELHELFPFYGWKNNAGYGTAEHLAGIRSYGVTLHHRRSYAPVREALSS